ncbi:hypothetical protein Ga0074812_1574 [Parafrankia irregularis]|uniref:C2H2-type domain-containing protein n=1 Tax=Parafrankia irregularis TaxID=795642 RepID=A0A0S4R2X4_9ACTN|nr:MULTISPECIES: hypothetical protein [Parafrankia]CUU61114.1 hypothetical protein Ga0074812_1574 [Parafrankia irregularis]
MAAHTHTCSDCGSKLTASSAAELAQHKQTHRQVVHGSLNR